MQRRPKSIRLTEDDEERSTEIAEALGIKWHRWMLKLVKWSNTQPKKIIRKINDHDDQEQCS